MSFYVCLYQLIIINCYGQLFVPSFQIDGPMHLGLAVAFCGALRPFVSISAILIFHSRSLSQFMKNYVLLYGFIYYYFVIQLHMRGTFYILSVSIKKYSPLIIIFFFFFCIFSKVKIKHRQ